MGLGFALDGVDDVGGAERNVKVGDVVLMKKRRVVAGDAYAEDSHVGVFQDEMMMRLLWDRDGDRRLSAEGKCEKKKE